MRDRIDLAIELRAQIAAALALADALGEAAAAIDLDAAAIKLGSGGTPCAIGLDDIPLAGLPRSLA